ncbi:MAG: ACT domain-containing protein [Nocardioidaceae bacterium]
MSFLLRMELPDVPGSLGAVATALGEAGADIEAIEIVEHRDDGTAVDDVLLELPPTVLPDTLVSACQSVDGVRVHWISRYVAGASLSMDLEAVEAMTASPRKAVERLTDAAPNTFRADWAMAVSRSGGRAQILVATQAAPTYVEQMDDWLDLDRAGRLPGPDEWGSTVLAGARVPDRDVVVVFGRRGGPEILDSEIARLGHLAGLAASIGTSAVSR